MSVKLQRGYNVCQIEKYIQLKKPHKYLLPDVEYLFVDIGSHCTRENLILPAGAGRSGEEVLNLQY